MNVAKAQIQKEGFVPQDVLLHKLDGFIDVSGCQILEADGLFDDRGSVKKGQPLVGILLGAHVVVDAAPAHVIGNPEPFFKAPLGGK